MAKRKFRVELSVELTIELDEQVFAVVDDEWRKVLYDLTTPEEIASHIAYNMVANDLKLSQMDGWADQPDSNAHINPYNLDWNVEDSTEVK